jgi:hypothetical protein
MRTFFCLECGYDRPVNQESDYKPDVCKECTGKDA